MPSYRRWLVALALGTVCATMSGAQMTHPLMPGVRCQDVWDPDWPRVLHDRQLTGFSPLVLGMEEAPEVWATIEVGGELSWVRQVRAADGTDLLLVNDGRLRLVTMEGKVLWTGADSGSLAFFGDLRGDGRDYVVLTAGARLSVLDAATGELYWRHAFEPPHVYLRCQVGDVLPDTPGMEAAVFQQYGQEGCLISFPPDAEPRFVWRRTVVEPGEHPERADHGCDIRLDLRVPGEPVIWNVRHHRCRGFEARTGETISSLVYDIGGAHRRNYGPWALGTARDGRPIICVAGEAIQQHVHGIILNRDGPSDLAWQHYYGEVYQTPGVALECISISDIDADGATEILYNVRDPEHEFRPFVRVRDGSTGEVEIELRDCVCEGLCPAVGGESGGGLIVRRLSGEGEARLEVHRIAGSGSVERIAGFDAARLYGVVAATDAGPGELLLLHGDEEGPELVRYRLVEDGLEQVAATRERVLTEADIRLAIGREGQPLRMLVTGASGSLEAVDWPGAVQWSLPLAGGRPASLSAADLTGDGRAELIAAVPGDAVCIYSLSDSGDSRVLAEHEFEAPRGRLGPLLYDLEGDGRLCLIAPGRTPTGRLCIRAWRADHTLLWKSVLEDLPASEDIEVVAWNAGEFLPGPRAGVAISVASPDRTVEGTFLLDGRDGTVLWFRDLYHNQGRWRGVRPIGIPGAFDIDGDGVEEVLMDMYSYMAFLRGEDGSFARIHHTANITAEDSLYAALLYNSYCPVYRSPDATEPHWFVPLGHGRFGLMKPDPAEGIWREVAGYDVPDKPGLIDVDGDGSLEAGYALRNSRTFVCRDLWSGEVEWELELPSPPAGPVLCADVDGDGRGEFLVGPFCIGTNEDGAGEVRWQAPLWLSWAVIADFDGCGQGEIATATSGRILVLKARTQEQ